MSASRNSTRQRQGQRRPALLLVLLRRKVKIQKAADREYAYAASIWMVLNFFVTSHLRLNCWQKSSNAGFSRVEPYHVLLDERIKNFVASTLRLQFTESEKEEEIGAIRDPIAGGYSCQYDTVLRHVAGERVTVNLSSAVEGVLSEDEAVDDGEYGH